LIFSGYNEGAMKKEAKEQVKYLMREINSPKSDLIKILRELESIGATKLAAQLVRIIMKLEIFQNKKI
jgi:hypothetical protein